MKTVKVAEATELQLDWLVAKCEGLPLRLDPLGLKADAPGSPESGWWVWLAQPGSMLVGPGGDTVSSRRYSPSTNWAQGGPIIERELIDIQAKFNSGSSIVPKGQWYWQASTVNEDDVAYWFDGPTPLIAAMRCYVVSKLGDTAEVPEELV